MSSELAPPGRLFCFGLGYSARFLAADLARAGWPVAGTSRDGTGGTLLFRRDRPLADVEAALAGTTHILVSIPPDEFGDPVIDTHRAALVALPGLRWLGYLSTTGVYGDRGGGWVDEDSALAPAGERGRRRMHAEAAWRDLWSSAGLPVHIFRLAGIYGPGRSPLDALRAGTAQRIDKPGQVFSRIHVEDLAAALGASMARPRPGAIYNVCDDEPAPQHEVTAFAAGLLGLKPPPLVPFDTAALSPTARSFYAESKRVSNRRLKEELGLSLRYPSYRDGLAALLG